MSDGGAWLQIRDVQNTQYLLPAFIISSHLFVTLKINKEKGGKADEKVDFAGGFSPGWGLGVQYLGDLSYCPRPWFDNWLEGSVYYLSW